jgi:hypothetical protein
MNAQVTAPVVIVGGGIAGLICAIELHRAGIPVQLYEAEAAVGGRVRTTLRDGLVLDHGFQVLFTAYPTLRAFLDLDALALRRFQPAAQIVRQGQRSRIGDALRDPTVLLDTVTARAIGVGDKLRLLALRRFAQSLSIADCFAMPYAGISTRVFLRSRGFDAAVIDGFFVPFYGGILLDRTLATKASVLLFTFKMLAEGDTAVPAAGMGAISEQLAGQLPAGCVTTNAPVFQLLCEGEEADPHQRRGDGPERRVTGVQLADGRRLPASQVVLATEAPAAQRLADGIGLPLHEPTLGVGCTTLYYTARRTPLPGRALWLNAEPDAVIGHAVTLTEVAPEYASSGRALIAATAVGEAATLADDLLDRRARQTIAQLAATHSSAAPSATAAALELVGCWRVPFAQYAQPPVTHMPTATTACGIRGLWRASEVLHSSSLDGAARGGQGAAQAIIELHKTQPR